MMNENRALWRSLHFLSRSFSLAALLALLVNDSLLRQFWPSALTGKISDLAWLFLAPVVVTAGLAWAAPKGLRTRERMLAGFGFGLTAAGFALFKTLPAVRAGVLAVWQASLGFPAAAVLDPTDLVALLSVALSAWLWSLQRPTGAALPLRAVFVIPLLALLTLADAAAPDYGIACLENINGQVVAYSTYNAYSSADGGLTWNGAQFAGKFCSSEPASSTELTLGPSGVRFRFQPGQNIERSTDGIQWQVAYQLAPLTQADQAYYQKVQTGSSSMRETPLGGIVDAQRGSVIFAMGHEGVLVRQSNDDWTWVAVGSYHRIEASARIFVTTVLSGEIVLTVTLVLLILSSGGFIRRWHWIWTVLIWTGWLGWGLLPLVFPPALSTQYGAMLSLLGVYIIAALAFLISVIGSVRLARVDKMSFLKLLAIALVGGVAYFVPYGLWVYNLLPQYILAAGLALLLGCAAGTGGVILVRNRRKVVQK